MYKNKHLVILYLYTHKNYVKKITLNNIHMMIKKYVEYVIINIILNIHHKTLIITMN